MKTIRQLLALLLLIMVGTNSNAETTADNLKVLRALKKVNVSVQMLSDGDVVAVLVTLPVTESRQQQYFKAILKAKPIRYPEPESSLELMFGGVITIQGEKPDGQKERITVCLGNGIFFWNDSTTLKDSFYSRELMTLLLEDLSKSKSTREEYNYLKKNAAKSQLKEFDTYWK